MKQRQILVIISAIMFFSTILIKEALAGKENQTSTCRVPFQLSGLVVPAGEMRTGFLPVPEKDGVGTSIPVIVIHGAKEGKVLALVAGIHGYEYPPILALLRLKQRIDPRNLSGTLILVPVAHLPSFQRRTIYYNPHDWKNLNRVFPGDPEGTLSQRIAYVLTREVVDRCDALIDMHCGDGNEALIPYTYWIISGEMSLDETSKKMALAFGLRHIIIDTTRTKDLKDSKYLGNTAILRKKPAITTESGNLGHVEETAVQANIRGALNVLRLFGMIPGEPRMIKDPVWIDRYEVIYSSHDGVFHPRSAKGQYVIRGQVVGVVTDYFGNVLEEVKAPWSGVLLYIIHTPPANKGEPLFELGHIKETANN